MIVHQPGTDSTPDAHAIVQFWVLVHHCVNARQYESSPLDSPQLVHIFSSHPPGGEGTLTGCETSPRIRAVRSEDGDAGTSASAVISDASWT